MLAWRSTTALCSVEEGQSSSLNLREQGCGSSTAETVSLVEKLTEIVLCIDEEQDDEEDVSLEARILRASTAGRREIRRLTGSRRFEEEQDDEETTRQLLREVERIWALCEAALLQSQGATRGALLAGWLREGCVDEAAAAEELEVLVAHFGRETEPEAWRGEEEDDDPLTPFWQLAYSTLLRGDTAATWSVLATHSAARRALGEEAGGAISRRQRESQAVDWVELRAVLLDEKKKKKKRAFEDESNSRARWKRRVSQLRQTTALETVAPGIGIVLAIVDGDASCAVDVASSWEEVVMAQLFYGGLGPLDIDGFAVSAARLEPKSLYMKLGGSEEDEETKKNRALIEAVYDGDAAKTLEWVYVLSGDVGVVACAATIAHLLDAAGHLGPGKISRLTQSLVYDLAERVEGLEEHQRPPWKLASRVLATLPSDNERRRMVLAALSRATPRSDTEALELAASTAALGSTARAREFIAERGELALRMTPRQTARAAHLFIKAEIVDKDGSFAVDGHLERLSAECSWALVLALEKELEAHRDGGPLGFSIEQDLSAALGVASAIEAAGLPDFAVEATFIAKYARLAEVTVKIIARKDDKEAVETATALLTDLVCGALPRKTRAHLLSLTLLLLNLDAPFSSFAITTLQLRLLELENSAIQDHPIEPKLADWLRLALAHSLAKAYVRENSLLRPAKPAQLAPSKPRAFDLDLSDLLKPPPL